MGWDSNSRSGRRILSFENSINFLRFEREIELRRKFPAEAAVFLSFTSLGGAAGLARAPGYAKDLPDPRAFDWTSTPKGASMLTSLVA